MKYCSDSFDGGQFYGDVQEIMQPFLRMPLDDSTNLFALRVMAAFLEYYWCEQLLNVKPEIMSIVWDSDSRVLEVTFAKDFEREIALLNGEQE